MTMVRKVFLGIILRKSFHTCKDVYTSIFTQILKTTKAFIQEGPGQ